MKMESDNSSQWFPWAVAKRMEGLSPGENDHGLDLSVFPSAAA